MMTSGWRHLWADTREVAGTHLPFAATPRIRLSYRWVGRAGDTAAAWL